MELKPGTRLRSAVSAAEVIVVKAPAGDVDLRSGGHAMVPAGGDVTSEQAHDGLGDDLPIGKRFTDADQTIEILVTKPGAGTLSVGETSLELKSAKPLPSSD